MMKSPLLLLSLLCSLGSSLSHGAKLSSSNPPVVRLAQGTITGYTNKTSSIDAFLGIPYALPPVRFARAKPVPANYGDVQATQFGPACSQVATDAYPAGAEDCLTVNVFRPAGLRASAKLPVAIYHYGGSFSAGATFPYTGHVLVKTATEAGKPFILVTMNYRVGMYGFAAGELLYEEVKKGKATLNVGYWDQREAQLWVAKHIDAFGGDPKRVTIWGQSAGAFAVGAHLTLSRNLNASTRPFRAAIMNSGTPQFPVTLPPTHPAPSATYRRLLKLTGCTTTSSSRALACLRAVSASAFAEANEKIITDTALTPALVYSPPIQDGHFFPKSPNKLLSKGKFADVPILTGNMNDEGTLFAYTSVSGGAQFSAVMRGILGANVTATAQATAVLTKLKHLYPNIVSRGSPYFNKPTKVSQGITNTSDPFFTEPSNNQYKRLSSLLGDVVFTANRRFMLANLRSGGRTQPAWAYHVSQIDLGYNISKGSAHGYDIPYLFGDTGTAVFSSPALYAPLARKMQRAWTSFIVDLDPRTADGLEWPQYEPCGGSAMLYRFKGLADTLIKDDFRSEAIAYLTSPDAAEVFSS
ncbi:hypothetical protein V8E36_006672 [Tilletia maclaganii]